MFGRPCRSLWTYVALIILLCAFSGVKKLHLQVVYIGDSITAGSGLKNPAQTAAPALATADLRKMPLIESAAFFNAGKSGATTLDFLPGTAYFEQVIKAADRFYGRQEIIQNAGQAVDLLLFSIMLGTNDSAIEGTHGAPVPSETYIRNLKVIIDSLLSRYPKAKVVIHTAPWYSDQTYNGAKYLKDGRERLVSYGPKIDLLLASYEKTAPGRVFAGDRKAFHYFEKHFKKSMRPEQGPQGVFYLHPNGKGARKLGGLWADAIYEAVAKTTF